jgi:IS5 family transposase
LEIVHSVVTTAANVNDVTQAGTLLHGQETNAFGDAGYRGVQERKLLSDSALGRMLEKVEQIKASIRAKVEHPFHIVKNLFRLKKARYKGLAKNHAQLFTLFGLANLVIAKRQLLAIHGAGAS